MEKNKLLNVTSIIMIVIGAIVVLFAVLFLAVGDLAVQIVGEMSKDIDMDASAETIAAAAKAAVILLGVSLLIVGLGYIGAGIIGVMQKSVTLCFVVAIVLMVLCGISSILSIVGGSYVTAIIDLVLPVLYLVGAIQLKKSAAEATASSPADETV